MSNEFGSRSAGGFVKQHCRMERSNTVSRSASSGEPTGGRPVQTDLPTINSAMNECAGQPGLMVRAAGLEPARVYTLGILSLMRHPRKPRKSGLSPLDFGHKSVTVVTGLVTEPTYRAEAVQQSTLVCRFRTCIGAGRGRGEIGIHKALKMPRPSAMRVQVPPPAPLTPSTFADPAVLHD